MTEEIVIEARSGRAIDVTKGQLITVIDPEGDQVADFYAERQADPGEFISTGVTIDCNDSLRLRVGDTIYSNRYRPLLRVLADDVGEHDLLHPCCRPEMYHFFYGNGDGHPNCLDNINHHLATPHPGITPVNLFMHTQIDAAGGIAVKTPRSRPGDAIVLEALDDLRVVVAACSVSESDCNGGRCTPIIVTVGEPPRNPGDLEPKPKAWSAAPDQQVVDDVARLLTTVPEWFGLEDANAEYLEAASTKETWTVRDDDGRVVGVTLIDRHFPHVAEVHFMVVDRARHGQGVGAAMMAAIEADARERGVRLLEVKTLGASHPDAGYARTRHFYEKMGFLPVEETDLWGPDTPCLIMVKPL